MKANELRLGNYVCVKNGIISIVRNIHRSKVYIEYNLDCQFTRRHSFLTKNVEPIPITEDWLIKFGFELLEKYIYCLELIKNSSLLINMKHKSCFIGIRDSDDYDREIIFPDYVHQLQNIFWCLTGKELILKE